MPQGGREKKRQACAHGGQGYGGMRAGVGEEWRHRGGERYLEDCEKDKGENGVQGKHGVRRDVEGQEGSGRRNMMSVKEMEYMGSRTMKERLAMGKKYDVIFRFRCGPFWLDIPHYVIRNAR